MKRSDNKLFSQQESVDFLITEYEQCFEQMRHYDTTQNALLTFALTGYISIFAATYAIYQYSTDNPIKYTFLTLIFLLSSLAGITILIAFTRNRIYYTAVAKQVNRIRSYFLDNSELDYIKYNNCYTSYNKPKNFHWLSTYSMYIIVISLLNASLCGCGITIFNRFTFKRSFNISLIQGIVLGLILLILELIFSIRYLNSIDNRKADQAVWSSSNPLRKNI